MQRSGPRASGIQGSGLRNVGVDAGCFRLQTGSQTMDLKSITRLRLRIWQHRKCGIVDAFRILWFFRPVQGISGAAASRKPSRPQTQTPRKSWQTPDPLQASFCKVTGTCVYLHLMVIRTANAVIESHNPRLLLWMLRSLRVSDCPCVVKTGPEPKSKIRCPSPG